MVQSTMANGMNAPKRDWELSSMQIILYIPETLKRIFLMDMERRPRQMALSMWDSSLRVCSKDRENSNGLMELSTTASGKLTK